MTRRYIIVSGYHQYHRHGQPWFHRLWWKNNIEPLGLEPERVVIVAASSFCPQVRHGDWIVLSGNLGDCGGMIRDGNPWFMPGCPAVWMIGAWIAYANQTDFIYLEQDALVFGPWVEEIYSQLGDRKSIFGNGRKHGGSSTAIFLIRHDFIPTWCRDYLFEGPENVPGRLPEQKWKRMALRSPENYCQFTFGYDSDRPYNHKDKVWYGEQFTSDELRQLEGAGLISCAGMPTDTNWFTNH